MQLYYYNGQVTNYQIDENGKLFNTKTQKFLNGSITKIGYLVYKINLNGVSKNLYAHRMVAETFLPPIKGKEIVNHKDGNKLNNNISNLEWVTKTENNRHAVETGLNQLYKKVYCYDKNKNLICIYNSVNDANRISGIAINSISDNATAERKPLCKGYYFNFDDTNNFETYSTVGGGRKPVGRYSLNNELLEKYETITEAANLTHLRRCRISDCAHSKIKTYGGYIWKFIL